MKPLRFYQKKAIERIHDFFSSDNCKAKIYISSGLGTTAVIASASQEISSDKSNASIAILMPRRIMCDQMKSSLLKTNENISIASHIHDLDEQKIMVTTYQDVINNGAGLETFDLIICDEAQFINQKDYFELLIKKETKFLGIMTNTEQPENWFNDAKCLFSYTTKDAMSDGYNFYENEHDFIRHFLVELLSCQGYKDISEETAMLSGGDMRIIADITAVKDNKHLIAEVKSYRNLYNSKAVLDNALKQIIYYKQLLEHNSNVGENVFLIVMPCEIDDKSQQEIFEKFDVTVWDINNLMYLCGENKELLDMLLSCIPYPALQINPKKPFGMENEPDNSDINESESSVYETYLKELENCKPGKFDKADKKYETLCTKIIKILFGTEFFKVLEQHKTDDEMFRMDLLCSLKGTTEFWKFLITFYKTKFVVFEYKNHLNYISQNYIYITEKYLFPIALRNVAFIISRKGFDPNAEKAALGCLKENGKLIISLNDSDLMQMLMMKKNGEEPSDYLLEKVESLLMSVSK